MRKTRDQKRHAIMKTNKQNNEIKTNMCTYHGCARKESEYIMMDSPYICSGETADNNYNVIMTLLVCQ